MVCFCAIRYDRRLASQPHQQPRLLQRVDFAALTLGASLPAMQRGMQHFDALSTGIRLGAVAPMAGSGLLRTCVGWRRLRSRAGCDAGFFQHRLGLLAARTAQQAPQTFQCGFAVFQQLGHVAQRADGRFQFLISRLAQRVPRPLQQAFQLFDADVQRRGDGRHLDLLQQLAKAPGQRVTQHLFDRAIDAVGLIVFASSCRPTQHNPVGGAVTGAAKSLRVHEGFHKVDGMVVESLPILGELLERAACVPCGASAGFDVSV